MKILSLDYETTIGNTIHGPAFNDPSNDIVTQIWATHPDWVGIAHCPRGFKRQLYDKVAEELYYADVVVGVNLGFDLSYIWETKEVKKYLLRGGLIWDCQEAEFCLTGQQHTTASLAELQLKYLGIKEKPSRISALFKKGIGADRIVRASRRCPRLFKLYEYYCKTDGSTSLKIFKFQYIRAKQLGMLPYLQMRMQYLLAQINMTCTGIHIDIPKCEELYRDYNIKYFEQLGEAQELLKSMWTDPRLPEFKVSSTDHKSGVLFGGNIKVKNGEEYQDGYYKNGKAKWRKRDAIIPIKGFGVSTKHTHPAAKEGFYSTDIKVLKSINADTTTPAPVLSYCKLQDSAMKYKKAAKTYCKAFIDRSVGGVLFPKFNNTIVPTGRLSSSEPNLQNVPAKSKFADDLMGVMIAPPGYKCVVLDFSQLEKFVQAWVSGDLHLTEKLLEGVCLHCLTLANIEGLDYDWVYQKAKIEQDPVWDAKRTNIKPIGFRMDYGGAAKGTSIDLGLDLNFVQSVHDADKALFPDKYKFFEGELPAIVNSNVTYSLACNISASKSKGKKGRKLFGKVELLPIFDKSGNIVYNNGEFRRVGYWVTGYGKRYAFFDSGRIGRDGQIRRNFRMPQFKNFPNQGGGADIQGITSAALLPILLSKPDKIKMINEIHDSKLFYIKEEAVASVIKWLKEVVEDVPKLFKEKFNIDVPFKFPCEFKIGDNFSPQQMKKYSLGESND